MYILGVDPGETTGICLIREDDNQLGFSVVGVHEMSWERRLEQTRALVAGTFFPYDEGEPLLPRVVVMESFKLRPGRAMEQVGSYFPSVRVIGDFEMAMYVQGDQQMMVMQQPSQIGRVQVMLEHAKYLIGLPHAADAYRHVRYYCLTTGKG